MSLHEIMAWEHWRNRLGAQEAMLALTVQHGKPQETMNVLTAASSGMSREEYEGKRSKAAQAKAGFMAVLARGAQKLKRKKT